MRTTILTDRAGRQVQWLHYAEISSTQIGCRNLAAECGVPLALTAGRQSSGRGRLDRRWESPLGNFYGSFLWDYCGAPHLALIELAVLAGQFLQKLGVPARLKWPNDIIIGEKKLAGLLGEVFPFKGQNLVILGIGINVNTIPDGAMRYPPITLTEILGRDYPISQFRQDFVSFIVANYPQKSQLEQLKSTYCHLCSTIGQTIALQLTGGKEVTGQAVGIDDDFSLIIENEFGKRTAFNCGDVKHLIISR